MVKVEFVKKEIINTYKIIETERIALVGILSILDEKGELKIIDETSQKIVKNLLQGFSE
jgi:hypothetical protein